MLSELVRTECSNMDGKLDKMAEQKSVNYVGIIPVLVEAIKEQQAMIEQLQQRLDAQQGVSTPRK